MSLSGTRSQGMFEYPRPHCDSAAFYNNCKDYSAAASYQSLQYNNLQWSSIVFNNFINLTLFLCRVTSVDMYS